MEGSGATFEKGNGSVERDKVFESLFGSKDILVR
jgi:hypothetical protein